MAARETPDTLMDGRPPYFDADPERSVWAETGYGQFREDLVFSEAIFITQSDQ